MPIHGVGVQGHHSLMYGFPSGMKVNLDRFATLGLDIAITEADVRIPLPVTPEKLDAQASYFGQVWDACHAVRRCVEFTTWGFTDRHRGGEFTVRPDVAAVQRAAGGRGQSDRERDEVHGGVVVVVDLREAGEIDHDAHDAAVRGDTQLSGPHVPPFLVDDRGRRVVGGQHRADLLGDPAGQSPCRRQRQQHGQQRRLVDQQHDPWPPEQDRGVPRTQRCRATVRKQNRPGFGWLTSHPDRCFTRW